MSGCKGQSSTCQEEIIFLCTLQLVHIQRLLSPVVTPGISGAGCRRVLSAYATALAKIAEINFARIPIVHDI